MEYHAVFSYISSWEKQANYIQLLWNMFVESWLGIYFPRHSKSAMMQRSQQPFCIKGSVNDVAGGIFSVILGPEDFAEVGSEPDFVSNWEPSGRDKKEHLSTPCLLQLLALEVKGSDCAFAFQLCAQTLVSPETQQTW